jgi:hypothetical protein
VEHKKDRPQKGFSVLDQFDRDDPPLNRNLEQLQSENIRLKKLLAGLYETILRLVVRLK